MSLYELQQALTKLERAAKQVEENAIALKEEQEIIADYELEISISTPYDRIDEEMSRFYPQATPCPYYQFDCMCIHCHPEEYVNTQEYSPVAYSIEPVTQFGEYEDTEEYPLEEYLF